MILPLQMCQGLYEYVWRMEDGTGKKIDKNIFKMIYTCGTYKCTAIC